MKQLTATLCHSATLPFGGQNIALLYLLHSTALPTGLPNFQGAHPTVYPSSRAFAVVCVYV